ALGLELLDHEGLAQRREGHDVAPAPDRLGQLVRPCGEQQEDGVGGRLLQDLQQGIGGRRRQPVGLAEQEDLPARLRRRPSTTTNRSGCSSAILRYASATFARNCCPSCSIRSRGSSSDRAIPSSGSRCNRITISGNNPWVAQTFSDKTSGSPNPRAHP